MADRSFSSAGNARPADEALWLETTDDVKRRIFGLNAARVYRVNPEAKRNPMPSDYIEKLRRMYKQSGALTPSNTQYGWVPA
jgi:hypothetical protein